MLRKLIPALDEDGEGIGYDLKENSNLEVRRRGSKNDNYSVTRDLNRLKYMGSTDINEDGDVEGERLHILKLRKVANSVEISYLSPRQKEILQTTWKSIYLELSRSLSYVTNDDRDNGITEPFLKFFENYPKSQQFFFDFSGTAIEEIKHDAKLSNHLQDHAIRVLRVVEKVIFRIEDLEKVIDQS